MIVWATWLAFVVEAVRLIFAQPGPMPSQFPALSALVAKYAGDQAGKADPWPIILEAAALHDEVKAEVEARFNPRGDEGDRVNFYPDALGRTPNPDDGERERKERDAAIYGMSLLEQRGLYAMTAKLPDAGVGVCLSPSEKLEMFGCAQLANARTLMRVLRARMELAAQAADWKSYRACVREGLALARVSSHQVSLLSRLVSDAITIAILDRVRDDLLLDRLAKDDLQPLLAAIREGGESPSARFWLESMATDIEPIIAGFHTDDGHGDGWLLIERWRQISAATGALSSLFVDGEEERATPADWPEWGPILNAAGVLFARRSETHRVGEELGRRLIALADKPYAEQVAGAEAVAKWARGLPESQPVMAVWGASMADAVPGTLRTCTDATLLRRGTQTLLAIEAYRTTNGRLPESLDALIPAFLAEAMLDPYSGADFVYRITDPKTSRPGRGFMLYSVWTDGKDNQGHRGRSRTQINATNKMRDGCDYIINDEQDARER